MKERKLLAAAKYSRDAFDELKSLDVQKDFTETGRLIFEEFDKFYGLDADCLSVDTDILLSRLKRRVVKESHFRELSGIVQNLRKVSSVNVVDEVNALQRDRIAEDLAVAFSQRDYKKADDLMEQYQVVNDSPDSVKSAKDGISLFDTFFDQSGDDDLIRLSPQRLNEAVGGGLRRHHHLLFFARPDMGKSTWAIHQSAYFLSQGLKVLYLSNEEHEADYRDKICARLLRRPPHWIKEHKEHAQRMLERKNIRNFVFQSIEPGTPSEITRLVQTVQPDVLIVDQSRNLNMNDSNKVTAMEKAEQFLRNLGKRFNMLTISLTQAGDSATGRRVLKMEDVDFSNTGVQASADVMVGMGADENMEATGERMLVCCKNKRGSDKSPFLVKIDFPNSRILRG